MPQRFPALLPPQSCRTRAAPAPTLPWVEMLALALCILMLRLA